MPVRPHNRRLSAVVRALSCATVAGIVGVSALAAAAPVAAAGDASGTVSGTVFHDFDSDGARDDAAAPGVPVDLGIGGVTITAVDADEDVVGTAVSGADGAYSISVSGARTEQLRLTFTDLPYGHEPSFSVLPSIAAGTFSASDVQLVTIGATAADFGINAPSDYSVAGTETPVVTGIHQAGTRDNGYAANQPSLAAFPWQDEFTAEAAKYSFNMEENPQADRTAGYATNRTTLATSAQTGTLWGIAAQRSTGDIFAAAVLKRHTDLGPQGIGGIYRVPTVMDPATGLLGTPGPVEAWLDLSAYVAPPGLDLSAAARGLQADPNNPGNDPVGFTNAGEVGIGGMAVSADQTTLYAVNLYSKELEVIDIASGARGTPIPLGLSDDDRPWAVTVDKGRILIGYIENATDEDTMVGIVKEVPADDPAALATAAPALTIPLDYQRGTPWIQGRPCAENPTSCLWHEWTDDFADHPDWGLQVADGGIIAHAQPTISELVFSADGDLVIGMQDRFSLQMGRETFGPNGETSGTGGAFEAYSMGDLLAAASASSSGGPYTLEDDGVVGSKTTVSTGPLEGPGGLEFFEDRNVYSAENYDAVSGTLLPTTPQHHETTTGGLAAIPGVSDVLSTAYDPGGYYQTNGFSWFLTSDGFRTDARVVSGEGLGSSLRKSGGLADVAALLPLAPLQIGNVVWFDGDRDGVQDADEPPVPGVGVTLTSPAGAVLATTQTDSSGQYYFDTGAVDGFDPNGGDYTVTFIRPASGDLFTDDPRFGTIPWSSADFTTQNAGTEDQVDSDADPVTGIVSYSAGSPGENDPTIDAGLVATVSTQIQKVFDPDGQPIDPDQTFRIDVAARDFRGDPIVLPDAEATLNLGDGDIADIPSAAGGDLLPAGTQLQITEPDDPNYAVAIDPADPWILISDDSPTAGIITVTNTRLLSTGFEIEKVLIDPAGLVGDETFTGEWECTYPDAGTVVADGTWSLQADEVQVIAGEGIPIGSTCSVTEDALPAPESGSWQAPEVGGSVVTGLDGTDAVPLVSVTNEFMPPVPPTTPPVPPTAPPVPPLPATGAPDMLPAIFSALALTAVGAALLIVRRIRRAV